MNLFMLLLSACNPCEFDPSNCFDEKPKVPAAFDSTSPDYVVPCEGDDGLLNCNPDNHSEDCYEIVNGKKVHVSEHEIKVPLTWRYRK